jgi:hypothetical protein
MKNTTETSIIKNEIAPCPFCGKTCVKEGAVLKGKLSVHCFVYCENCLAHGPHIEIHRTNIHTLYDQHLKEWNTRRVIYDKE